MAALRIISKAILGSIDSKLPEQPPKQRDRQLKDLNGQSQHTS